MIKSTNISNLFMIVAQSLVSISSAVSNLSILAPRYSLKPKPLAEYRSLYTIQLIYYNSTPTSTTIDRLLAQFKANIPAELDSDSDSYNIY